MQLMHLKPINSLHGHQKPIKGGHFHHVKDMENHTQILEKETLQSCHNVPTTTFPSSKKFYSNYHYNVTKVPWGATPKRPSPSVSMA